MAENYFYFVYGEIAELIHWVAGAFKLTYKKNIKRTSQQKMREFYKVLESGDSSAFYNMLKKQHVHLVQEEHQCTPDNPQPERTTADSPFADGERDELIQHIAAINALAYILFLLGMITKEEYLDISDERTSQQKMRELYEALESGGSSAKTAFYNLLKKEHEFLVQELERKYTSQNPSFEQWERTTAETSHGRHTDRSNRRKEDMDDKKSQIKQNWQKLAVKSSRRWENKLNLLLDLDSDLKIVGSLFLCTKRDEYIIGTGADGTTIYLGLKEDGTEVAIKRMIKSSNKDLKNEMLLLRELESSSIVKYVDLAEDDDFYYLALQLCEYNLEEYINNHPQEDAETRVKALKKVAREVLLGIDVLHTAGVLHRDIKPKNVLIDVKGNARLADFGISRKLNKDQTSRYTLRAGTEGWEAREVLMAEKNKDGTKCTYRKSTDIQVAGMLVYYILSGGHHPFDVSEDSREKNIKEGNYSLENIKDVEAKDLIEGMIKKEPNDRLEIKEAIGHPYFWDDMRRVECLRKVGDEKSVQNFKVKNERFDRAADKFTEGRSFSGWKSKVKIRMSFKIKRKMATKSLLLTSEKRTRDQISTDKPKSVDQKLPDNIVGLLRYLRNLLVHDTTYFNEKNMFREEFPDFFISVYKLAKEMGWEA